VLVKEQYSSKTDTSSIIITKTIKLFCLAYSTGEVLAVMNISGEISITDHTHFRGSKTKDNHSTEVYLFRSLVNCAMVQCKRKEA